MKSSHKLEGKQRFLSNTCFNLAFNVWLLVQVSIYQTAWSRPTYNSNRWHCVSSLLEGFFLQRGSSRWTAKISPTSSDDFSQAVPNWISIALICFLHQQPLLLHRSIINQKQCKMCQQISLNVWCASIPMQEQNAFWNVRCSASSTTGI